MCSTIATPPPRRIVWAGRAPSLSSSMLRESMPTSAAPAFTRCSAASSKEWMLAGGIRIGAPVRIPPRMYQYRPPLHLQPGKSRRVDRSSVPCGCPNHDARQIRDVLQRIAGHVVAAVITMEGRVDVRPGVREQVDLADLKGRARRVAGTRGVTRQPVADRRCGKTAVGHHPVLDLVAQVDQAGHMRANALSSWPSAVAPSGASERTIASRRRSSGSRVAWAANWTVSGTNQGA